jgi:hypothetical protein
MDGSTAPDVTLERLHEIARAFARRDVDGIVHSFAEDGEFPQCPRARLLGPELQGQGGDQELLRTAVRQHRRREMAAPLHLPPGPDRLKDTYIKVVV